MAYQTGAATNLSDMLSQLATFLAANGWVTYTSGTNAIGVELGSVKFYLEETLDIPWRIFLHEYASWDTAANAPVGLSATLVANADNAFSDTGGNDGIVYEYHFFTGNFTATGEVYVHVAFRTKPLYWSHISFGELLSCAGEETVLYATANDMYRGTLGTDYAGSNVFYPTSSHVAPAFTNCAASWAYNYTETAYNLRVKSTFNGVYGWSEPAFFMYLTDAVSRHVAVPIIPNNAIESSVYSLPLHCNHIISNPIDGPWQGVLTGSEIPIFSAIDSTTTVDFRYLGKVPGAVFADCYKLEDGYSVTVGADTYRVFPLILRDKNNRSLNMQTGPVGLAYKG